MIRIAYRLAWVAAIGVCLGAAAGPAAADVMLVDANSTASISLGGGSVPIGMYSWSVDGTDHMYRQWFWYRVGPTGGEQSIDALTPDGDPVLTDTDGDGNADSVSLPYLGTGFDLEVRFKLVGGDPGSGVSDILEFITVNNTSGGDLDFHLFQYTDLDLNGVAAGDTVEITGGNTATQTKGATYVAETVVTQMPSHFQADVFDDGLGGHPILDALADDGPTDLTDQAGPIANVDAVWAFQWDRTIADGDSLIISKDKNITPEPATLLLTGLGLAASVVARRRK